MLSNSGELEIDDVELEADIQVASRFGNNSKFSELNQSSGEFASVVIIKNSQITSPPRKTTLGDTSSKNTPAQMLIRSVRESELTKNFSPHEDEIDVVSEEEKGFD